MEKLEVIEIMVILSIGGCDLLKYLVYCTNLHLYCTKPLIDRCGQKVTLNRSMTSSMTSIVSFYGDIVSLYRRHCADQNTEIVRRGEVWRE